MVGNRLGIIADEIAHWSASDKDCTEVQATLRRQMAGPRKLRGCGPVY